MIVTLVSCLLGAASPRARAQQDAQPRDPSLDCSINIRQLAISIFTYADKHKKLPPDMYAALTTDFTGDAKAMNEMLRARALSTAHQGMLNVPAEPSAGWMNEHASYKYLGSGDIDVNEVPEWGSIVIAHLRLEQGHQRAPGPDNPDGQLFTLAYLDGHVELHTRESAERVIAKSIATLDSLRTGADAPDDLQAVRGASLILKAIQAYAKAHDGSLPPDLGATLAFVPSDTKATATPKQRGRIYLSPRAQKTGSTPDEPTPEWVNSNTWYVYLGAADLKLADIPEPYSIVLIHSRTQDPVVGATDRAKGESVVLGKVGGHARLEAKAYAEWLARESERTFTAVRTGEGLPDWVHAMRDLRAISDAARAYTRAHDSMFPPDLAALLPYLPARIPGIKPGAAALVFLSPRAEAAAGPGASAGATAEWVKANATYVYTGRDGDRLTDAPMRRALLHGPLDETYRIMVPGFDEPMEMMPCSDAFGGCAMIGKEWVTGQDK